MKEIQMENWPRREIFEFFSQTRRPFYSLCFSVDVSKAYRFAKSRGLSFYYCMTWLVTQAVNRVEAFLYTIHDGKVFLLPRRKPSFTDMAPGATFFHICTMDCHDDISAFCARAEQLSKNQKQFINYSDERPDLIYISCLPWLELSALTNEGDMPPDDCIPRISWGKYVPDGEKLMLTLCLELNHRFIDGAHVGEFARELNELMDSLE